MTNYIKCIKHLKSHLKNLKNWIISNKKSFKNLNKRIMNLQIKTATYKRILLKSFKKWSRQLRNAKNLNKSFQSLMMREISWINLWGQKEQWIITKYKLILIKCLKVKNFMELEIPILMAQFFRKHKY